MNTDVWELETLRKIWNNKTGEHFEVGPDRDGLGIVEVRLKLADGKIIERLGMSKPAAKLVADAIYKAIKEIEET